MITMLGMWMMLKVIMTIMHELRAAALTVMAGVAKDSPECGGWDEVQRIGHNVSALNQYQKSPK